MAETMGKRAAQWIVGNDTGMSSKALWGVMMGVSPDPHSHPSDGADLGRCVRLLDLVPEWKPRLPEMAALSPYWAALVPEWDRLADILKKELAGGRKGITYEAMKAVLNPVQDKDRSVVRLSEGVTMRFGRLTPTPQAMRKD